MSLKIPRASYASMFGPTVGDRVRLADTDLIIEVEQDFTRYGEEVKFGGGKVIRDGMGQSPLPSAETPDLVITNALILDHWGIVKADVAIKEGRISGIGKAGPASWLARCSGSERGSCRKELSNQGGDHAERFSRVSCAISSGVGGRPVRSSVARRMRS